MPSLGGEWGRLVAPLPLGASPCRQTDTQGPGALQSPERGLQVNLPGWPHSPGTNEGFVSRASHQRLSGPLGRQPGAGRAVPQPLAEPAVPAAPGQPWLCLLLAHQSDGSVSTRQGEGRAHCSTAGSSHSLPRSQEPRAVSKQSLFAGVS